MASLQEMRTEMIDRGRGDLVSIRSTGWPLQHSILSGLDGLFHYPKIDKRKMLSIKHIWLLFNPEKLTLKRSDHYSIQPTPSFPCFVPLDSCLRCVFPTHRIYLNCSISSLMFLPIIFSFLLLKGGTNPMASKLFDQFTIYWREELQPFLTSCCIFGQTRRGVCKQPS